MTGRTLVPGLLGLAGAAVLASGAYAGALAGAISSDDGMWQATLDGNGTGQITDLFRDGGDNLFETLWYERSIGTGGVTARVEDNYTNTGSNIGSNFAEYSLTRNDGALTLDVRVDMLDGPGGGARFALLWTNISNVVERVQPYIYADLDVSASAGGDFAEFNNATLNLEQSDPQGVNTIHFGSIQNTGSQWEISPFASLRDDLDAGRTGLTSSGGGGPDDFTSALAGDFFTINEGQSLLATFQFSGEAVVPAPGAMAILGLAGVAGMRRRRR